MIKYEREANIMLSKNAPETKCHCVKLIKAVQTLF